MIADSKASGAGGRPLRLCVVEDSSEIRARLRALVAGLPGVELCGEAGSVAEAAELVGSLRPDAMILDLRLPDGSGAEALLALRGLPHPPRVIVFTQFASERLCEMCLRLGAHYFLDKSRDLAALPGLLGRLTDTAGADGAASAAAAR